MKLQLGGLLLDLDAGELLDAGGAPATGLRRQALEVLLVLGRRAGQVVGKDDLMAAVWPRVVVGEGSLTQAIAEVRRALGDSGHRLVRNVPRRGYMLVPDTPADAPPLSIVVLPLAFEGAADDDEWLADALHGDLIVELSRLHGSVVIARDTAAAYPGAGADPRQVARELRVRHVVQGRLRREGSAIRITLALVDGQSGAQRWTEAFVFERARLAQAVADCAQRLGTPLYSELVQATVAQRASLSPLEVTADDLAMRAVSRWMRRIAPETSAEGLQLAERALALDPDCLRAWNAASVITLHGMANGWLPDRAAALARLEQAAAEIERLDPGGFYSHQSRVIVAYAHGDAVTMLRLTTSWKQRHRQPNAHGAYGMAALVNGMSDEAVAALEFALQLSPRDSIRAEWQWRIAMAHYMAGRDELAVDWGFTAADTNPALAWPAIHAAALWQLGQADEARSVLAAHLARHAMPDAAQLARRLPGSHERLVQARERLLASLRACAASRGEGAAA